MLRGRLWQMPAVLARVVSSSTNVQSVRHCSTSSGRSEGESGVKGSKTGVWDAAGAGAKEAAGAGGGGAGARDAAGSGGGGAGARHSSGAGGAAPAAGGSSVTEGVAGAGAAANPPPGRANTFVRLRSLAKTASYKRRAMEKDPTRRGRISLGTPLSPRMMQVLRPPRQGKESWRREAEEVRSHSHWTEGDEGGPFGDMSLGEWVFPGARGFPEDMDISALRSPEEINELARRMHPSDREWSTEKLEDHALPAPPTPAHRRFISLGEARNVDPVRLAELARQASEYGFAVHFSSPTPGAPAVAHTIGLSVHGGFAYELLLQAVSPQACPRPCIKSLLALSQSIWAHQLDTIEKTAGQSVMPSSSASVYLLQEIWQARALSRSKVDQVVP
ncbi:hypothetical protein T484DRAFT_2528400 [Baffinella frigidus]|nr:hypothetical protein T484DRAFT_2528400 [Cryptophyta sp. CCMP2293]